MALGTDTLDRVPLAADDGRYNVLILVLIVAVGIALRLPGLRESLWYDESYTWIQTRDLDVIRTLILTADDTYPPLHNLLTLPFLAVFGQGEIVLRLPSLVFGVLAIPAMYWVGSISAGRRAGLIAALLMALAPFAIRYSQEARMYALLMLAATLHSGAILLWLRLLSWRNVLAVIGSGAMLLYSHPYGAIAAASVASGAMVAVLLDRTGWRRALMLVLLYAAIAVTFLPWFLVSLGVAQRLIEEGFWIDRPTLVRALGMIREVAGGWFGLSVLAVGGVIAIASLLSATILPEDRQGRQATIVLLGLAVGPIAIGFIASQVTTPILLSRYLICSLPAWIALASIGYVRIAAGRVVSLVGLVLVGGLSVGALAQFRYPIQAEDWRSAARYLRDNLQPTSCLVLSTPKIVPPLDYYGVEYPKCTFERLRDAVGVVGPGPRLIAVASHSRTGIKDIESALPGNWTRPRGFRGIQLAVREPGP